MKKKKVQISFSLLSAQMNFYKAIEEARDSVSKVQRLDEFLVNFTEQQVIRKNERHTETTSSSRIGTSQVETTTRVCVCDPIAPVLTKGRPKKPTRIKSSLEESLHKKKKKQRACSNCRILGHYITGCPQKS